MSRYATLGASSRVRSYQYLPFLHEHGVSVTVSPLFSNAYLQTLYDKRTSWLEVIKGYSRRFVKLFTLYRYDVVIIEKELFPFFPAIFERLLQFSGRPYLVDYDDALFHRYDCHKSGLVRFFLSRKIDTVMRNAAVVVAGNHYLAERAEKAGAKKVIIIPTVVDTDHYVPLERSKNKRRDNNWMDRYAQNLPLFIIANSCI
ncbi:group 1 glycosyl transferase [Methylophaga lonarensis MPL]|uniref:Group 1 glycosyl transferase n=2 Tax=Methylophaga lonarensis TaxID=999151 RepID=M7PDD1_9GAMM|nr:group 1 glycosyl transferase [Methylophaga lonarensis MPL]